MIATETQGDFRFKIIGVGDAGCRALSNMIAEGVSNAEFVAVDTDAQALAQHNASDKLAWRTAPGTIAYPVADEGQLEIIRALLAGVDMAFITASMAERTGASVSAMIAKVAREMGLLTVGVIVTPFPFEGSERQESAEAGTAGLAQQVDSLIVIPADRLMADLAENPTDEACFKVANEEIRMVIAAITDVLVFPGLVGIDFWDVRWVLQGGGPSRAASAMATGIDRATIAATQATAKLSLEGTTLSAAHNLFVNISASRRLLKMREINDVMNYVKLSVAEDAQVMVGAVFDESLQDRLRVTMIAAALDSPDTP